MGRRSKGEGSVYRHKNGYWVAQLNGTYKYAKTEREAKKKLLELLRNSDQQQKPSQLAVSELMEQWLDFTRGRVKESTAALYQEHIDRYINPAIGAKRLDKVDALTVQQMYSRMLSRGLSPATVKLTHSVMSSSFKRAVKWGLLSTNPISNVDAPRIAHKEIEVSTLPKMLEQTVSVPGTMMAPMIAPRSRFLILAVRRSLRATRRIRRGLVTPLQPL